MKCPICEREFKRGDTIEVLHSECYKPEKIARLEKENEELKEKIMNIESKIIDVEGNLDTSERMFNLAMKYNKKYRKAFREIKELEDEGVSVEVFYLDIMAIVNEALGGE